MSDKFQNRYRIPSARADWWDYGWNAAYFVTICTAHREHYFGEIVNGNDIEPGRYVETGHCPVSTNPTNSTTRIMKLSEIGQLAENFWRSITEHFPFVKLDVFVVMPNHIHGILVFDKLDHGRGIDDETGHHVETGQCPVSTEPTQNANSTPEPKTPGQLRYRNQGKDTLSSIIGSYKSIVTKQAHRIHADFEWQERFHDHIIRDEEEFCKIVNYIGDNVINWRDDKFYS
jgi:hypothetical protein